MKKYIPNIGGLLCLAIVVFFIYKMLLQDGILPFSINSVQASMNHWVKQWHVVAIGLLPVYVALVFFGAALCGVCFGSAAQRWVVRFLQQK